MEFVIISIVSLLASALTFFAGFGLGTILLPVFALFFPIDTAIALTAIVHFLNNLFKIVLIGKNIDKKILLLFGIPSFLAAFGGAFVLTSLSHLEPIATYELGSRAFSITVIKITIAILMIVFAVLELKPSLFQTKNGKAHLLTGGLLSGFFGGVSGHQGAMRSIFLVKAGLSKEAFIATGTAIAVVVDIARLSVYSFAFLFSAMNANTGLLGIAVLFAFIGAYAGNKLLKKITIVFIQKLVVVMLIVFALLIGGGII